MIQAIIVIGVILFLASAYSGTTDFTGFIEKTGDMLETLKTVMNKVDQTIDVWRS